MPKEWISPAVNEKIAVGWAKDQASIQVATIFPAETPDEDGRGVWVSIQHREHVNALIRNLRKARDQAFGRDE